MKDIEWSHVIWQQNFPDFVFRKHVKLKYIFVYVNVYELCCASIFNMGIVFCKSTYDKRTGLV